MKKLIVLLVSLLFVASYANATLITNGDFEQPDRLRGWGVYQWLPGWDLLSGSGIEIQTSGVVVQAQSGNQYVELDSHKVKRSTTASTNSAMAQTVELSTGSYLLDFWYQPRNNRARSNDIYYGIEGLMTQVIGGKKSDYRGWTEVTLAFDVEEEGFYDVVFAAQGREDTLGGFIDNVSLTAAPVPEPSTILLLGAGLVAIGFYGRKRKKV